MVWLGIVWFGLNKFGFFYFQRLHNLFIKKKSVTLVLTILLIQSEVSCCHGQVHHENLVKVSQRAESI